LKCAQSSSSGTSSDTASTISNNENLEAESAIWVGQHQPEMADALETLQTLPPTYNVDVLVRELESSKAELSSCKPPARRRAAWCGCVRRTGASCAFLQLPCG